MVNVSLYSGQGVEDNKNIMKHYQTKEKKNSERKRWEA